MYAHYGYVGTIPTQRVYPLPEAVWVPVLITLYDTYVSYMYVALKMLQYFFSLVHVVYRNSGCGLETHLALSCFLCSMASQPHPLLQ